jgi:signal transduction histidine kinase
MLHTTYTFEKMMTLLPYVIGFGASVILFIFQIISYYYYRDYLLKQFCIYLVAQMAYLLCAILYIIIYVSRDDIPYPLLIVKESLEILTYFFYIRYTTNAIGFDKQKHPFLTKCIRLSLALLLCYLPLQPFYAYILEADNTPIFIGVRLLIFGLAIIMFWQSYKIKDNIILPFIRLGAIVYFVFGLLSFIYMVLTPVYGMLLPYHFILIGTLLDLIIFSVAMSHRNKHQIVTIEKVAAESQLALQAVKYEQEIIIQQQREEFRKSIAMDLHDDIGSSLSSILINSEIAQRIIDDKPQVAQTIIQKISMESKEISNKISDFIWSLKLDSTTMPTSLKKRLLDYQQFLFDEMQISCIYLIDEDVLPDDMGLMRNILLIIKEAMNNTAKYADAKTIRIKINKMEDNIQIEIADDGKGFDVANVNKGNGLSNINARCKAINAMCNITSELDKGTKIEITIPTLHSYI